MIKFPSSTRSCHNRAAFPAVVFWYGQKWQMILIDAHSETSQTYWIIQETTAPLLCHLATPFRNLTLSSWKLKKAFFVNSMLKRIFFFYSKFIFAYLIAGLVVTFVELIAPHASVLTILAIRYKSIWYPIVDWLNSSWFLFNFSKVLNVITPFVNHWGPVTSAPRVERRSSHCLLGSAPAFWPGRTTLFLSSRVIPAICWFIDVHLHIHKGFCRYIRVTHTHTLYLSVRTRGNLHCKNIFWNFQYFAPFDFQIFVFFFPALSYKDDVTVDILHEASLSIVRIRYFGDTGRLLPKAINNNAVVILVSCVNLLY